MQDPARVRDLVRKVVLRTLGVSTDSLTRQSSASFVTEQDIKELSFGGELLIPSGSIITPLARQIAMDRHITLISEDEAPSEALALKPSSRVSHHRIESVARHYRPPQRKTGRLVNESDVNDLPFGAEIRVSPGSIITPLARQVAMDRRVTIVEDGTIQPSKRADLQPSSPVTGSGENQIAIGADHGGVAMKAELITYLQDQGYVILDCGTSSMESVDYPDYALAVAQFVANGQAWRGIIIDGAGIGSCMAANKVPGIRAALCGDAETARGAKAWNQANVLCLSLRSTTEARAREILDAWFSTEADPSEEANVRVVNEMDERLRGATSAERAG